MDAIPPPTSLSAAAQSRGRASHPPAWLAAAALTVALLGLLPIGYLLVVAAASDHALGALLRERTIGVLARTLALAGTVTALSVLIGVPIAWLTTRSDLPGRRWWAILSILPLVVP